MSDDRPMRSEYMEWAKTRQKARYTLALSGILTASLSDLGAPLEDFVVSSPDAYGWRPLREAIASTAGTTTDRIVTTSGTSGANHVAMSALIRPGDEVVIEHPVYEPMAALARYLGAVLKPLPRRPENGFRIDPGEAARAIGEKTRLVVVSNLHNPAPVAIDEPTLRAIGEAATRAGARVLVDEVYLDAAFEWAPPSAATLGDQFVVTTSLTKVYGVGGLRAGWIVAEPKLAERMWHLKNLFGVDDAHPAERLALIAHHRRAHLLARARRILDANRAAWHAFLAGRGADLDDRPVPIGTTAFPRLRHGEGDALERILRARYETSIVPGRFFGAPEHVRIGLTGDPAEFPEGLARLGRALDDLREGRA